MSKTRPRVVLVGAGGYGRLYVEALTSQDMGAELTAICDICLLYTSDAADD